MGSTEHTNHKSSNGKKPIPKSPAVENDKNLGFTKQAMVDWFSPSQLAQTGLRAIISSIFGSYSDKRELQAALNRGLASQDIFDFSDKEELWVDYISDMGSGWNSTYSMAYLLGQKKLGFTRKNDEDFELPRADILVMGGDEVYPTPTWKAYNDRFVAPYQCSLPYIEKNAPSLFAIPGNHDWYDGLSSFLKLFCQGRWIGGWQTRQTRSYFAVKLPHNWWLWGIDIQLKADIDKPQMDYFDEVLAQVQDGDHIILCTAEPVWVYQEYEPDDKPFKNLEFFENRYSSGTDKKLDFSLMLTGDMHHYTSFKEENEESPKWRITAGGGGAFLHPTHQVPDALHLDQKKYSKSASFPDSKTSKRLAWNNLKFPFINRKFGVFFGVIYLLFTWWAAVSNAPSYAYSFLTALSRFSMSQFGETITLYKQLLLYSPGISFLLLVVFAGIIGFADKNRKKTTGCWILGILHGFLQVILMLFSLWVTAFLLFRVGNFWIFNGWGMLAGSLISFVLGWIFSGYAMGFYLLTAILVLKTHETEAFSSFRGADYKNFIRMNITPEGIKLYAIKVPKSCKKWKYNAGVEGEKPWYEPADNLKFDLIEDPILIKKHKLSEVTL